MVDVVRQADRDAPVPGALECVADDVGRRVVQADVVERDVEAVLGRVDELGDRLRDLGGVLSPVRERANFDQERSARIFALCARFFS